MCARFRRRSCVGACVFELLPVPKKLAIASKICASSSPTFVVFVCGYVLEFLPKRFERSCQSRPIVYAAHTFRRRRLKCIQPHFYSPLRKYLFFYFTGSSIVNESEELRDVNIRRFMKFGDGGTPPAAAADVCHGLMH